MTKLNGHGNGHDQANVTSLDEARKRAARKRRLRSARLAPRRQTSEGHARRGIG